MASPAVVGTPAETAISTASTTHTVNLPSGAAGNYFVAVMSKGSAGTTPSINALAGWTEVLDEAIVLGLAVLWHLCDGTEGATVNFTLSSATRGAWIVYEVSGMQDPAVQAPQIGTTATGSSTTPDPPSVSVTGGAKDILTIAFFGRAGEEADDDTWVTAAPSGFGTLLQKACGTAGTNLAGMVASAHLASNTATSNPGTFTIATGAWRAQTVVLHPAPAVHNVAANLDLGLTMAAALGRETFIAANLPLGATVAAALTVEKLVAAALDLGLTVAVNLESTPPFVEHFIAADLPLDFQQSVNLTREHLIAANLSLDLQQSVNLVRETFLAASLDIGPSLAAALIRETFIASDLGLGPTIEAALTRETFLAASLDLQYQAAVALILDHLIAASFPVGLPITVNLTVEGPGGGPGPPVFTGAGAFNRGLPTLQLPGDEDEDELLERILLIET